ncbi:unnamed protein product [Ambrosiozyma monospora]|uniref:Unnamed protein product n=1 Tax=Ambrosiozyma monospora TaxID=43982 RepID=A0ACB5SSN5_AMBMO|nr:unnamed protein product [Ambrosiozyma monospora]
MAFLFKRNPKTPAELIRAMNEQITKMDTANDKKKAQDEVTRYLISVKAIVNGGPYDSSSNSSGSLNSSSISINDHNHSPQPQPDQLAQLAHEVYTTDSLVLLISNLSNIEFDSRKIVVLLFNSLLRRKIGNRSPTIDYLLQRNQILTMLMKGTANPEISIHTTGMLKEAIKYEQVAHFLLFDNVFWKCFDYCQSDSFEISTDAFSILIDLLTLHKEVSSQFFQEHKLKFIDYINRLITSKSYVTKREAIRLLAQLILSKSNYHLMAAYNRLMFSRCLLLIQERQNPSLIF